MSTPPKLIGYSKFQVYLYICGVSVLKLMSEYLVTKVRLAHQRSEM